MFSREFDPLSCQKLCVHNYARGYDELWFVLGKRNVQTKQVYCIDGLQSRDETAMLVDKTIANYGSYFA